VLQEKADHVLRLEVAAPRGAFGEAQRLAGIAWHAAPFVGHHRERVFGGRVALARARDQVFYGSVLGCCGTCGQREQRRGENCGEKRGKIEDLVADGDAAARLLL